MPTWIITLIQFLAGAGVALAVQHLANREAKWKVIEDRKSDYAKRREPQYAKALEFIYKIEAARPIAESIEKLLHNYQDWLIMNAFYFPPNGKKLLFSLQGHLAIYFVNLRDNAKDEEGYKEYRKAIDDAEDYFLNSRDITWFPIELGGHPKK